MLSQSPASPDSPLPGDLAQQQKPERWKMPGTPEWLTRVVDRLEAIEKFYPTPTWLGEGLPSWALHIARELAKTCYPVAGLKPGRVWHPGEVGALLGHQFAYWHWFAETVETNCNRPQPSWDELRKVFGADIEERSTEMMQTICEKVAPAFDKALKFALCIAADQEYHEASAFFAAYGRAIGRKPRQGDTFGRTTTTLYWVMLTSWRRVVELGSIHELHRRLCRCIFLGPHLVGDLKRVEKICERIGLSYQTQETGSS